MKLIKTDEELLEEFIKIHFSDIPEEYRNKELFEEVKKSYIFACFMLCQRSNDLIYVLLEPLRSIKSKIKPILPFKKDEKGF